VTAASGGQQLTPNNNVAAVAGNGGDIWGAFGGGAVPVGGGVNGVSNVVQTLSNGQRETNSNYIPGSTTLARMSNGAVQGNTADNGPAGPMTADDNTNTFWPADMESPGSADSQL
jgi:hypothetical protein